jgi:hypothetical protein
MQAAPSCSDEDTEEYGFEIPVMSPQVEPMLCLQQSHDFSSQSVERAAFARLTIESHYEILLMSRQVASFYRIHVFPILILEQSAEERKQQLVDELKERGASEAEVA